MLQVRDARNCCCSAVRSRRAGASTRGARPQFALAEGGPEVVHPRGHRSGCWAYAIVLAGWRPFVQGGSLFGFGSRWSVCVWGLLKLAIVHVATGGGIRICPSDGVLVPPVNRGSA